MFGFHRNSGIHLIIRHHHQPVALLEQNIRHHAKSVECVTVLILDDDLATSEAARWCRSHQIEWAPMIGGRHIHDFLRLSKKIWCATVRTEEFLDERTTFSELICRAEEHDATLVLANPVDQLAFKGALTPLGSSVFDDFPIQCALMKGLGDNQTPVVLVRHRRKHQDRDTELPTRPILHRFMWHEQVVEGLKAHTKEALDWSDDPKPWIRAQEHLKSGRVLAEPYLLERPWIESWYDYENLQRALVRFLPEKSRGVEVGVCQGRGMIAISDLLALNGKDIELTAVDSFGPESSGERRALFEKHLRFAGGKADVLEGDPVELAQSIAHESQDYVFLDASTRYESVLQHLEAWWSTVKPGGIFCGHDYHQPYWPDVTGAVDHWAEAKGLKVNFAPPHSWWIAKPPESNALRLEPVFFSPPVAMEHVYNPALAKDPVSGLWVTVFRTSGPGWQRGRLWACTFDPVKRETVGKPTMLMCGPSEEDGHEWWYEDPRLIHFKGRLWMSFLKATMKSGYFVQVGIVPIEYQKNWKLAEEPQIFKSPFNRPVEKNWIFFEHDGRLKVLYSMAPWIVLEPSQEGSPQNVVISKKLVWSYGVPCGGTPFFAAPNGKWWALFHSKTRWAEIDRQRYFTGVVEIDPVTLEPVRQSKRPMFMEIKAEVTWSQVHVIWPAGAVIEGDELLVSCGHSDHSCMTIRVTLAEIEAMFEALH